VADDAVAARQAVCWWCRQWQPYVVLRRWVYNISCYFVKRMLFCVLLVLFSDPTPLPLISLSPLVAFTLPWNTGTGREWSDRVTLPLLSSRLTIDRTHYRRLHCNCDIFMSVVYLCLSVWCFWVYSCKSVVLVEHLKWILNPAVGVQRLLKNEGVRLTTVNFSLCSESRKCVKRCCAQG